MEPSKPPRLDLQAVIQGFVDDLRAVARPPADRDGEPAQGPAQLKAVAEQVRGERERAAEQADDRYQARTEALRALVVERQRRLNAYARRQRSRVPPLPGRFVAAGRVTDQTTGQGLPHVRIRATDLDRRVDDVLGEARTDALGYFRFEYDATDFAERDENPETYIEVLDEQGEVVFTSTKSFIQKAGQSVFIPAAVDAERLPTSRRLAEKVTATVAARDDVFARRRRVLDQRPTFEGGTHRPGTAGVPSVHATPVDLAGTLRRTPARGRGAEAVRLADVEGLGPTFRKRLAEKDVTDVRAVAHMEPVRLARLLDTSEGRAANIVAAAQRLAGAPGG